MRILLIKTSSMGDIIHTLPALTDAMRAIPGINFDWVVEEGFVDVPSWHPAVGQIIPVAIRRWRKNIWRTWRSGEYARFRERIMAQEYDLVLDAQGLLKSAWLTRGLAAPVAGADRQSVREKIASRFYNRHYPIQPGIHAVERIRQLFAAALDYPLPQSIGDYGLDRQSIASRQQGLPQEPYLMFLHGTTWPSKHWPEENWRALAEHYSACGKTILLPWGTAQEQQRARRIAQQLPGVQVLPRMSLTSLAGYLAAASVCVAVDTGLGHLAAALATPCVSLYGPTSPKLIGAYGANQVHLCATGPNAGKRHRSLPCFDSLDAGQVIAAVDPLLP